MMNFAPYHKEVQINFSGQMWISEDEPSVEGVFFQDAKIIISGDTMIINLLATNDDETKLKTTTSYVYPLSMIRSYETKTEYNPDAGLDNKEQLNG